MLKQALQEMHEHYDERDFNEHLIWFQSLMERTQTISEEEKHIIEEVLQVQYQIDPIIRENSTVMAIAAEAKAEGRIEGEIKGKIEGKVEGLQEAILDVVSDSFSAHVVSQVQQTIAATQNVEQLKKFHRQITHVSDEQEVTALLAQCFPPDGEAKSRSEYEYIQDLILDAVSANFSSQVVSQVQQTIAPIQDTQLLRKFNRQLVRVSNEQEISALLAECFPTH